MPNDLLSILASTGTTGVVASLFAWAAWKVYQREVARNDRLERELRSMRSKIEEKLLPALIEASRRSKEIAEILEHHAHPTTMLDRGLDNVRRNSTRTRLDG